MGKVIKILAGLFIVVIIGVVIAVSTFDVNQYKGELTQLVEEATGRKLQIGGEIRIAYSLKCQLGFETRYVESGEI